MARPGATNADVARLFLEAAELLELAGENPFRVRAYQQAARTIEELDEPVARVAARGAKALDSLPGIGEDLAEKIRQIVATGTFPLIGQLRKRTPKGLPGLLKVPGLGPKRARVLYDRLGIRSVAGLARAARAGKVRGLPGFGAKTESAILAAVGGGVAAGETRMLRARAASYAEPLVQRLRAVKGVERVEVAGSFRRGRETVGDLDLLVTGRARAAVVEAFTSAPGVARVLARGTTRAAVRLGSGLQVDLRVLAPESFGAGLYYFTGSKAHNVALRGIARAGGLKINEYGVFRGKTRVAGRTEEEVLAAVGLPWIPPELREDRGEIAAARAGRLPELVTLRDLRGDLQCHTTDSDGRDELEAMARAAEALGHEYLAVTDHSPSVRVTGGMDAAGFRAQRRRIDRLNAKLGKLTVLAGAEVDILGDGRLDLDDATLAGLDVVVISIHSRFNLPEAEQTRRVLRALAHPAADILGHPTGRIIGRRAGIALDLEAVARAAAEHGVMLEVNAQPERLDLDDLAARAAVERGARLVIGSDAHATAELGFLRWGVDQARRGWVERKDVANALPLARLLKLLHGGRR
ncbi:MAG TPA: DNA polymerase/3'-5' exonuclease PolX [Gemmatimonadales bacterium]|nr:DNA polymerase/3'-5' exonuclease PolX [Gemmatimonadales bacterium]